MEYTLTYNHQSQFIEMFGNPLFSDKDDAIKLREATEIVLGSTPNSKNEQYWNGNLCWITPAELSDDSFEIANTERHISEDGAKSANLTLMPKGTVLLSTRAPIGKVALTTTPMYCNQGFKNMICTDLVNNVFLYYTLKYNKERLQSMGTGTTFKELSKKVIESIKISLPSIQAQKEFESIYRQADKSKFDGFKSQFIEMTSSSDETCRLLDLVQLPIKAAKKQYQGTDRINYIDISSIDEGSKSFSNTTEYIFENAPSRAQQCVMAGDILYSTVRPNLQNFGVVITDRKNLVASSGFCVLRPKDGLRDYVMAVISSDAFTSKMVDKAQGGVFPAVNQSFILHQEIPFPSERTIQKVASIVRQADKSKYYVQNNLNYICHILTNQIQ